MMDVPAEAISTGTVLYYNVVRIQNHQIPNRGDATGVSVVATNCQHC